MGLQGVLCLKLPADIQPHMSVDIVIKTLLVIIQLLFYIGLALIIVQVFKFIVSLLSGSSSNQSSAPEDLGYRKRFNFMNKSEATFFHSLVKALPPDFYIFPKTRVADIIKTIDGEGYYYRRNRILPKHVDFLICSSRFEPLVAIEVDGASHNSPKRQERDQEVDEIFQSIDVPLVHVRVGDNFKEACDEIIELLEEE